MIEAPERFWNKVEISAGCWNWTGALDEFGYGIIWSRSLPPRSMKKAHRVSWMLSGHPLAKHKVLHHTCENRRCVNPRHLRVTTRARHVGIHRRAITQCKYGHSYTPENTALVGGRRNCRRCISIRNKRRYDMMREAA